MALLSIPLIPNTMDELKKIAAAAASAGASVFANQMGVETETKGVDRKQEETANTLRWPVLAGFGLLAALVLILAFKRR